MSNVQRVIANPVVSTCKILNGASESSAIALGGRVYFAFTTPAAWTTAAITFLASNEEAGTYSPVYTDGGTELTVASGNVAAGRNITLSSSNMNYLAPFKFIKLRSGVAATPVNQGADRTFIIHTK